MRVVVGQCNTVKREEGIIAVEYNNEEVLLDSRSSHSSKPATDSIIVLPFGCMADMFLPTTTPLVAHCLPHHTTLAEDADRCDLSALQNPDVTGAPASQMSMSHLE